MISTSDPYSEPPEGWNMGLGGLVLGSPILYLKGKRILMFQLSGFYYILNLDTALESPIQRLYAT